MKTRTLLLIPILCLAAVIGCAGTPTPPADASPLTTGRVVVAPLNLAVSSPLEAGATGPVWDALLAYLRLQDRPVATLEPISSERLWLAVLNELEAAGGDVQLEAASALFAQRLAEETEFDLLVLPSVVLRRAPVDGRDASWDGVRRRIELTSHPNSAFLGGFTSPGFWVIDSGYRGWLAGASLHVSVRTAEGTAAFEGVGGLDLVQDVVPPTTGGSGRWSLQRRSEVFGDPAHLSEGVGAAFEQRFTWTASAH